MEDNKILKGIVKYLLLEKGFSLTEAKQYQEFLGEIEKRFSLRRDDLERVMRSVLEEMLNEMIIPSD